ncbi:PTS sugar transporter subunit IIA [Candidatus Magnetomoraceae bacterium gMMP-15]
MNLSPEKVAKCLSLPITTIERWARQGRIPVETDGNNYIFSLTDIKRWAKKNNLVFSPPKESAKKEPSPTKDTLLNSMKQGGVFYDIKGESIEDVLKKAAINVPLPKGEVRNEFIKRLLEREKLNSTGIGNGVAIPHSRTPMAEAGEKACITTCFLKEQIPFNSVDDKPVFVLFILLSPSVEIHLTLLSRLAFCIRDNSFIKLIKKAPEADILFDKIASIETKLDKNESF